MIFCDEAKKRIGDGLKDLLDTPEWRHIQTCDNVECRRLWDGLNRLIDLKRGQGENGPIGSDFGI